MTVNVSLHLLEMLECYIGCTRVDEVRPSPTGEGFICRSTFQTLHILQLVAKVLGHCDQFKAQHYNYINRLIAAPLHPKLLVSFPIIPFPETIKLRIRPFRAPKKLVQNVSL